MSRLVVVSNRVAPIKEGSTASGGLAVAVLSALRETGGVWFGWSGEVTAAPRSEPSVFNVGRLTYATVDLTPQDHEEYYNGFANRTLWPLFHYRLDLTEFSRQTYAGYLRVNALFARTLARLIEPGDTIWVHDYHLIPLGEQLRHMGIKQPMGFFLHTPLPPPEIMYTLPNNHNLFRSLCAYDVVGFQTATDLRSFHDYITQAAHGEVLPGDQIRAFGETLTAKVFPIGVNVSEIERESVRAGAGGPTKRLRESLSGRDLILGTDRLDYSKGLPQRFQAFERFLETYPAHRSHVTYMQIAPPSRTSVPEYMEIRRSLEEAAGHINGRFAEVDWVPIRYLNKSVNHRSLMGFCRLARIGFVAPLRDGMNLVAKEYVAAQNPNDPGVLVLSRFAGAAQELKDALIVNPYDIDDVAEALERGLLMPLAERRERWNAMITTLRRNNVSVWRDNFLGALQRGALAA